MTLAKMETIAQAYAEHTRLHADFVDTKWGARRKATMTDEHEAVVRKIIELGGRHAAKNEDLDNTLPQELLDVMKARYISNEIILLAEDGEPSTSRIQVMRTGVFYHPRYGKFTITDKDLATMAANFADGHPKDPTEMVVDYEHMSVSNPPTISPAAGWVKGLEHDEQLFATVEWTADAAEKIGNKEYRFISPEFSMNFTDKESGKRIGPTLVAVALTNRPFLEGMEPVVLSEELEAVFAFSERTIKAADEEGAYEELDNLRKAYQEIGGENSWVIEVYDTYIIAENDEGMQRIPYVETDDGYTFDTENAVEVKRAYVPAKDAPWTVTFIDGLPDNSFAFIKPGGKFDAEGKTVPRSLRYLPYKVEDEVSPVQLRDALDRLPLTDLTAEQAKEALAVLTIQSENLNGGVKSMSKELAKVLGCSEDEMMVTAKDLVTKANQVDGLNTQLKEATDKLDVIDADALKTGAEAAADKALTEQLILPKQRDWAINYYLNDKEGFESFIEAASKQGPPLDEKGNEIIDGDANITLTDNEKAIGKRMGVSEEDALKQKKLDVEAAREPVSA